ncbi:DMT family transporter [Pararhodobacter zhoushanensis]|uniref:DMT family transporter n=1 Tax=Pararhodobacter zhoushanensis TaxID=2479545 RepID=A0ABT3GYS4_9RHOB|nr:DMT family transporter [Pararhodobacter zhoushanensis]MCW1932686.1 DMT family transporter [Pararhodobacter zhoushanensis]
MRLLALSALVMVAFAANSLLNRAAVGGGLIEALPFALIRVTAGALVLAALARAWPGRANLLPALWLTLYLVGFSLAYRALDSGIGALILFAGVQVTMLAGAVMGGEQPPARRFWGAGLALAGLAGLLLPGADAVPALPPALLMGAAALGWGLYSLAGRRAADPLQATAANFLLATPMVALACLPAGLGDIAPMGWVLAIVSGAVTSGLGYALWYAVLPQLGAARAAAAQLTVPVIALAAGAMLMGERLSSGAVLACAVVLAGVALATLPRRR